MKFAQWIAAAALAFAGVAGASTASAAPVAGASTLAVSIASASIQDRRYYRDDRRWDRRWDRNRHDRGRYHNRGRNRVCWSEWRHHQRVTVCRRRR